MKQTNHGIIFSFIKNSAEENLEDWQVEQSLRQVSHSDPEAFELVYSHYRAQVYRYLRLRAGSEEDAIDLTQQVFLQAFKALPGYQDRGLPIAAWLIRIARNAVTDFYRRQHKTVAWDALPEIFQPAHNSNPEDQALRQEQLNQLRQLLAGLNQEKRELLALRFAAGLSSREIGLITGKSEAAVKKQLGRILAGLKEQYREQEDDR